MCDLQFFFFFKQKTAYEIMPSLVGSEMCIRDSMVMMGLEFVGDIPFHDVYIHSVIQAADGRRMSCLLYTSDAADDLLCVDLGGRRIIKKKKNNAACTT